MGRRPTLAANCGPPNWRKHRGWRGAAAAAQNTQHFLRTASGKASKQASPFLRQEFCTASSACVCLVRVVEVVGTTTRGESAPEGRNGPAYLLYNVLTHCSKKTDRARGEEEALIRLLYNQTAYVVAASWWAYIHHTSSQLQ